jgi:hypothetical protein
MEGINSKTSDRLQSQIHFTLASNFSLHAQTWNFQKIITFAQLKLIREHHTESP